MTRCFNCCGQSFDGMMCPNCNHPAYKRNLDDVCEVLGPVIVDKRDYEGFSSVGPLQYQTQGLMSYAISPEWVDTAINHPTLAVLFCRPGDAPDCDISLVLSHNPLRDFVRFHNYLARETQFYGSRPTIVHRGAQIHKTAVLNGDVSIWNRTIISANAVIGIDGARFAEGIRIEHAGGVSIGKDCFIGAGSVIVRGVWGNDTEIGDNCYIGQLVSIGHNTIIGNNCMILPGVTICGSCQIGNNVRISPNATISDHIKIGDGAHVTLGSVVTRDVEPGETVSGNFAIPHNKWLNFIKKISGKGTV